MYHNFSIGPEGLQGNNILHLSLNQKHLSQSLTLSNVRSMFLSFLSQPMVLHFVPPLFSVICDKAL